MSVPHFVLSLVDAHLGLFYFAVEHWATKSKEVQVFLPYFDFISFGYIPRSRMADSYDRPIFTFQINRYIVFQNNCTNLHSYQQCNRVPFSLQPQLHLLFLTLDLLSYLEQNNYITILLFIFFEEAGSLVYCAMVKSSDVCLVFSVKWIYSGGHCLTSCIPNEMKGASNA